MLFRSATGGAVNINGVSDTAAGSDIDVNLGTSTTGAIVGSGDNVTSVSGDVAAIYGNNDTVDATGGAVNINGVSDTAVGSDIDVNLGASTAGEIVGNGDKVTSGSGDVAAIYGSNDTVDATGGAVNMTGLSDTAVASNTNVNLGANTQAVIDGSNDGITGGAGDAVNLDGQGDTISGTGDVVDFVGSDTGDKVSGSGDTLSGDTSGTSYNGTPDPTDPEPIQEPIQEPVQEPGGEYGFAGNQSVINAALSSNIGSVAQYDLSQSNQSDAAAAEAAFQQVKALAAATPTSGTGSSVLEAAKWDSQVITWNLAGNMGTQYDTEVEQAFSTWAAASGITFEEVSNSSQANIQIGLGDLNTATSGVVGYTTFQANNAQMSNANIELEDPNQDALVSGANGQLTYSGTDATLEQVLLHEIGHALGLADNSDQDSIMYYELTSSNQTLNSTDIVGIQSLYGAAGGVGTSTPSVTAQAKVGAAKPASSASAVDHQLNQLIAGMASFNPQTAANTSFKQLDQAELHHAFAANSH